MKVSIKVFQNDQGLYVATCPSLPGCKSVGQTPNEAEERLLDAITGYIAALSDFVPDSLQREVVEV